MAETPDKLHKGGRPRKNVAKTTERREEIKRLIENIGLWNLNHASLAAKWGISPDAIADDIAAIIKGIPKTQLEEIRMNVEFGYRKAIKEMQAILATGQVKERIAAATAFARVEQAFNMMLEAHGIKEKVADKLEHSGNIQLITPDWWFKQEKEKEAKVSEKKPKEDRNDL